jgi:hypothetical protein
MLCIHEITRSQLWWVRCTDCGAFKFHDTIEWSGRPALDGEVDMLDAVEAAVQKSPWIVVQMIYSTMKEYETTAT